MDERCPDCQDQYETTQTILAHEAVDESNLQYTSQWLVTTQPSGHDWISSEVRIITGSGPDDSYIREEFTESITNLVDRLDDRDLELLPTEAVCNWCHLTFLAKRQTCPTCEMADL
jgi:uncharacterized protein with PIN domain